MFNNAQEHFGSFQFLFTKFEDSLENKEKMSDNFADIFMSLEQADKQDKDFTGLFQELCDKTDNANHIKIISPLNKDDNVRL